MAYYLVIMHRDRYTAGVANKCSELIETSNPIEAKGRAEAIANGRLSPDEIAVEGKYFAVDVKYIYKPKEEPINNIDRRKLVQEVWERTEEIPPF
ncbi:hypothetical protein QDF31_000486 [Escherichia coli]|nr:hypothetical protein [Escherichia coli]